METFAQRGLAASSLSRCGTTGFHPSHRRHLLTSFYVGRAYSVNIHATEDASPRTFGFRMLARLLHCLCTTRCCLRPRGCRKTLVTIALSGSPAPSPTGSAHSQNRYFSGLWVRVRACTLHLEMLANDPIESDSLLPVGRLNLIREGLALLRFPLDNETLPG